MRSTWFSFYQREKSKLCAARWANLQRHWLEKLELQQSFGIHYCRASGMPIMSLARCLRWAVRFHAVRLYRNITSIYRNGRQFDTERFRSARITTRRTNFPECFCSSFQQNGPLHRNVLSDFRLKAAAHGIL